jgi:integrase
MSAEQQQVDLIATRRWTWPLDVFSFDRTPTLSPTEREALAQFVRQPRDRAAVVADAMQKGTLARLMEPLHIACATMEGVDERLKIHCIYLLLRVCAQDGRPFWAWEHDLWVQILGTSQPSFLARHAPGNPTDLRQYVIAFAYLLHCFHDFQALGGIETALLARKIFGRETFETTCAPILEVNAQWGYSRKDDVAFCSVIAETLLLNESPYASDLTYEFLAQVHALMAPIPHRRAKIYRLSRILVQVGSMAKPLPLLGGLSAAHYKQERERGIAPPWVEWVERWYTTTPRPRFEKRSMRGDLLRLGRWLAVHHPEVATPADLTRELAAEVVAAVNQMAIGDFSCETLNFPLKNPGNPWSATRKHGFLGILRRSFTEAQEWGWMEKRFNPQRAFATPPSLKHQFRVAPRIIVDDIWAKLLWAGLNLRAEDCPLRGHHRTRRWPQTNKDRAVESSETFYPLEMIRALAILWLFAGLRSDELSRLRVGCARMQTVVMGEGAPGTASETPPNKPVCLLDIPVHKTGRAFTKPVDPLVGEAIAAWEAVRPVQPDLLDPKTGEHVQFLFCCRAKHLSKSYLNHTLIPALCQRAGVPRMDARGSISSHRARSTIASQLFNARDPMSLFELQAWLGHQSPATTQHYVLTSPTKLTKAYQEAGYFERNVRSIAVLIDQDVVKSGAVAAGEPWKYYDLGHGYCTYDFFDQCPHRMACAKCAFYQPKRSAHMQIVEGKTNLQRMLQGIPLGEEERAAVEDGIAAFEALQAHLQDMPTPAGPTPRQLRGKRLPVVT